MTTTIIILQNDEVELIHHILDLRNGYPLPTQGTWEWIGGWSIEERHDDSAGITGEDWKNGSNISNRSHTYDGGDAGGGGGGGAG